MNIVEMESPPKRPSMKERQRQLREEAILDAAVEIMSSKGFNAMTLEDITEAIGISRPTLYQHFDSKEDVLMHVAIRKIRTAHDHLKNQDPSMSAADRVRSFVSWVIQERFGPNSAPFYDISRMISSCGGTDPRIQEPQKQFRTDLTELVERAQAEGDIRSDIRGILLCEAVMGLVKNIGLDQLVADKVISTDEIASCSLKLLFLTN